MIVPYLLLFVFGNGKARYTYVRDRGARKPDNVLRRPLLYAARFRTEQDEAREENRNKPLFAFRSKQVEERAEAAKECT